MVHRHFTSNLLKKKSSITSFHPSFSVVQLAKWYASSYPPTFSHSLGKHIALYNRTGFRDKLLRYTLRWHPVDVLAARCSKVLAKWQLWVRTGFGTGYPRAESSKPASVSVCQSLGQDFEKLSLVLPTTPCTHAQARSPSLVVHSWTANGLSTCLKLNIPLRLPVPRERVRMDLQSAQLFLWITVQRIHFLVCTPLVPCQKTPHFEGNVAAE